MSASDRQAWTPGPWRWEPYAAVARSGEEKADILNSAGVRVMSLTYRADSPTRCRANARLIAAAPELYAALEACEKQIEVLMTWVRDDMSSVTAVCARGNQGAARTALAKARGEAT